MVSLYFPKEEYEDRWRRVHTIMRERGFQTAVVFGRSAGSYDRAGDVLYLTNFYSGHSAHEYDTPLWRARSYSAVILQDGGVPELHMDEIGFPLDLLATERVFAHMDPIAGLAKALNERNISGKVALVGSDTLPVKYWQQLKAETPRIDWEFSDDIVREARCKQSPRELDCLREGGEIVTKGLNITMEYLIMGKTEAEAVAAGSAEVMKRGGVLEYIRCSSGDRIDYWTRSPVNGYSTDPVKPGDVVRCWMMGPMKEGYFLDPGRTTVCGKKPTPAQKRLVEGAAAVVDGIIAAMKPGVKVRDLAKVGDALMKKHGAEDSGAGNQWPLYGHRQGLFWDSWIGHEITDPDDVFEAGTACSSETFLFHKGVGLAGFEQNVIIREDGVEILTKTPMLWW